MYYVGIDGGGTNTRACILDENGRMIGLSTAGPSSIDTVDLAVTQANINQAIMNVVKNKEIQNFHIKSIFIGIGGVLTEESKHTVKEMLMNLYYIDEQTHIQVENDVYSAFLGGLATRSGICIIAGTGSVAFGVNEAGKQHRAGGYGFQEGDLGSAYHLGLEALRYVARVFDKRYKPSLLSLELMTHLKIKSIEDLMGTIMKYHNNRTLIASLAPYVTKCATSGDVMAKQICDQAVNELVLSVQAVYQHLEIQNLEIAIIGSVGNSSGYFKDTLYQALKNLNDQFDIHPPRIDPVVGSAYQAFKNLGNTLNI